MTELITLAQLQQYKGITSNIDTAKALTPYIIEAQELDLRPFLSDEFYLDLLDDFEASPSLTVYSDLYNGVNYTYNSRTYRNDGLVTLLVHYTYARYLNYANVHNTRYGFVQKTNEFSENISEATRARMIAQAKSQAVVYQERVKDYLDRNRTLYPLWKTGINRRQGGIKLIAVGGNSSRYDYFNGNKYCDRKNNDCCNCENCNY